MQFKLFHLFLLVPLTFCKPELSKELDLGAMVEPVNEDCYFINPDYHIWGASVVKGYDGKYHMYYSRWEYELGHMGCEFKSHEERCGTCQFGKNL